MNYKAGLRRTINVGGSSILVPEGATVITLQDPTLVSSSADALLKNATLYQVPTGKVFRMVGAKFWVEKATGGGTGTIYQADTEDATTFSVLIAYLPTVPAGEPLEFARDYSFTAGKFITIVPSTTNIRHTQILGYEL